MSRYYNRYDFDISRKNHRYIEHEREYILLAYEKGYCAQRIAEAVHRTPEAVRLVLKEEGVEAPRMWDRPRERNRMAWTESDDDFLRENIGSMTHGQMAKALGRTNNAVRQRCQRLGLRKQEVSGIGA